jgi:hypothetical protein
VPDAATVLAIAALAVSSASAVIAWRATRAAENAAQASQASANEARRLADIEAERRHDERRPDLQCEIESMSNDTWHRLVVTLTSADPVDGLDLRLEGKDNLRFELAQTGVASDGRSATRSERLLPHTRDASWRVSFDESDRGKKGAATVSVRSGDETWTQTLPVALPPERNHMFVF